jgi:RimJ/RimL family protein N-acetyltransferase
MAQVSMEVGFGHLSLPGIASRALPDYRASQRVMEKVGFRYERDFDFAGLLHRFYQLVKGEWEG